MYVPLYWFVVSIIVIAYAFWRMFMWIEKRVYLLKARDEWVLLLQERELDPKAFCEKYSKELPDSHEYYYLHKYYKKNQSENVVEDASPAASLPFPDFLFDDKDLKI